MQNKNRLRLVSAVVVLAGMCGIAIAASPAWACVTAWHSFPYTPGTYIQDSCYDSSLQITVTSAGGFDNNSHKYLYVGCTSGTCNDQVHGKTIGIDSNVSVVCSALTTDAGGSASSTCPTSAVAWRGESTVIPQ